MYALRLTSFRSMIACYFLEDREREQALGELADLGSGDAVAREKLFGRLLVDQHYRERLANRLHRIEE